jgi:hypothetical protein
MFSSQIVTTDQFLEMPLTSQALYFHLGMSADDDGFVSPRKILRMCGAGEDDLKILFAKGFAIHFQSGIVVITHWKQNNYIQADRYSPTIYKLERGMLSCIQNVYKVDTTGIQDVSKLDTQEGREDRKEVSKRELPLRQKAPKKNENTIGARRMGEIFEQGRNILRTAGQK